MNSLEFAIRMEVEGEAYYRRQAELNQDNVLNVVFGLLAANEAEHAQTLKARLAGQEHSLKDAGVMKDVNNVFKDIRDFLSKENADSVKQIQAYEKAMKIEQESIDLYTRLLKESRKKEDSELFKILIAQEEEHYRIFDDLLSMIKRPEEWVESAEFGTREEY